MKQKTEETTTQAPAETKTTPKGKATVAKQARDVAPKKGKAGKKATQAKKTPKGATKRAVAKATPAGEKESSGVREGSKTAKVLDLLRRPGGVTNKELLKATGWQPHSVRGFLSGTVGKKMNLTVVSTKGEDGERTYSIEG
jgi:hypothetical protein